MLEVTGELQGHELLLAPRIRRTCDPKYVRVSLGQEILDNVKLPIKVNHSVSTTALVG